MAASSLRVAALVLALAGHALGEEPAPRPVTLAEALAAAAQAPARRAAAARTRAAGAAVEAAGAWPAVKVGAGTTLRQPRMVIVGSLPLPIFGTLGADVAVARADLDVARAEEGTADLDQRQRVETAWIALARGEARAALATETAGEQVKLADAAHRRFDAGDVPRVDVVAADAALARVEAAVAAEQGLAAAASAALASELGWPPERALHAEPGLPPVADVPPLESLRDRARNHPQLRAAAARVEVEERHVTQSRRARLPSLSLDLEGAFDDPTLPGSDFKAGLAVELPIFGKGGAAVEAAQARRQAAALEREAAARAVDGQVVAAYRRAQAAAVRARALEGNVLPAERETAQLALKAYEEGQGSIAVLLQAQRARIDVEIEVIDALAEAATARAELRKAVGGDL